VSPGADVVARGEPMQSRRRCGRGDAVESGIVCVCVCVCVCAFVCACVCVCVCVCVRVLKGLLHKSRGYYYYAHVVEPPVREPVRVDPRLELRRPTSLPSTHGVLSGYSQGTRRELYYGAASCFTSAVPPAQKLGEPIPGTDGRRGEPILRADVCRGEPGPAADVGRVCPPSPGADVGGASPV
jgi:hypothetical protein